MTEVWASLTRLVQANECAALVTVLEVRGSAPREAGARMIVAADGSFTGTIGGGQLEWEAIQLAAGRLGADADSLCLTDFALGPDLGQCCGGRVDIAIEIFGKADLPDIEQLSGLAASGGFSCETVFDEADRHATRSIREGQSIEEPSVAVVDRARRMYRERFADDRLPVLLFGAGHVGRALVLALASLPFRVTWVDSRPDTFPKAMPQNVCAVQSQRPAGQIGELPAGGFVIVMTHNHPLDLELCRVALARPDLPYVGVIGSDTKRARFIKRLRESGLDETAVSRLRCPIGISGINGKEPPVIAAAVAADLLRTKQACTELAVNETGEILRKKSSENT